MGRRRHPLLALFLVGGAADDIYRAFDSIDGVLTKLGSHDFGEMLLESVAQAPAAQR